MEKFKNAGDFILHLTDVNLRKLYDLDYISSYQKSMAFQKFVFFGCVHLINLQVFLFFLCIILIQVFGYQLQKKKTFLFFGKIKNMYYVYQKRHQHAEQTNFYKQWKYTKK